ncbi:MAG TPA: ABC transporter permease [Stellaceae bacterium]|nr:ABC transporter permease [Stellaceae bacterium]
MNESVAREVPAPPSEVEDEFIETLEDDEQNGRRRIALELTLTAAVIVVSLALWSFLASLTSPLVLPAPGRVGEVIVDITKNGSVFKHIETTTLEIILGFILGSAIGLGAGIALAWSPLLRRLASPYLVASQAVPKLALAPMFTLWLGYGIASKVVIAALIAFFPLLENTVVGLCAVESEKLMLFKSLLANEIQTFTKLRLPHARPYIFAGLRMAMLFATVGAIVGEYVGSDVGLGAMIIVSDGTMNTTLMFAVLIILTALGILLYKLVQWMEMLFQRGGVVARLRRTR